MNVTTFAKQANKDQGQSAAHDVSRHQNDVSSTLQREGDQSEVSNGGPKAVQSNAAQTAMNSTPKALQMKALHDGMNNSPKAVQMKALHTALNNSPKQLKLQALQSNMNSGQQTTQYKALQGGMGNPSQTAAKSNDQRNDKGLPNGLKSGIEQLSGYAMDDVRVHYNSGKPAQLQAHAFAQGTDIHLGAGQEQHLAHEAWHVVQQKQGRVQPTTQMKGIGVNDNPALEKEADDMGAKAAQAKPAAGQANGKASSMPQNAVVQGYFKDAGYRVADDLSVATKDSNPWNRLYAKPGKVGAANTALKGVGASVELAETTNEKAFANGGTPVKLKQVEVKNKTNSTEGDNMELYADCGRSNSLIVGSLSRGANYTDKSGKTAQTTQTNPEMMKYEIMHNHFQSKMANASTILASMSAQIKAKNKASKALEPYTDKIVKYQDDLGSLLKAYKKAKGDYDSFKLTYDAATTKEQKKLEPKLDALENKSDIALLAYQKKYQKYQDYLNNTKDPATSKTVKTILDEYFTERKAYDKLVNEIMGPYNALSASDRDSFDQKVGINKYANPSVGSGYTISSGGANYPNTSTWNFHWGGVVMESDDTKDKVVLENYSVSDWDAENKNWDLQMYGTQKKGQTFHEQHEATKQHGQAPTTMDIKKQ